MSSMVEDIVDSFERSRNKELHIEDLMQTIERNRESLMKYDDMTFLFFTRVWVSQKLNHYLSVCFATKSTEEVIQTRISLIHCANVLSALEEASIAIDQINQSDTQRKLKRFHCGIEEAC
ncbi:hypothetical protein ACOME3_004225 [Neoechinorhynchus agilis]